MILLTNIFNIFNMKKISKWIKTFVYLLLVELVFFACNADEQLPANENVYVAGYTDMTDSTAIAAFWKNGEIQKLTDGNSWAQARSIFVSGNDIYVAGFERKVNENSIAKLWKNGVEQCLTDGVNDAGAYSVFVFKNDVYVAGNENMCAAIWKNGNIKYLSDDSNYTTIYTTITSLFISDDDVYAVGYERERNPQTYGLTAKLWKNGELQNLVIDNDYNSSVASSVYVKSNDVYVSGNDGFVPALWKNGEIQHLADDFWGNHANSIFVYGKDVYVVGNQYELLSWGRQSVAMLWKNGEPQILSEINKSGVASSVYVNRKDVYVVGREFDFSTQYGIIKIWKNGVSQNLTDGTFYAEGLSIFVK